MPGLFLGSPCRQASIYALLKANFWRAGDAAAAAIAAASAQAASRAAATAASDARAQGATAAADAADLASAQAEAAATVRCTRRLQFNMPLHTEASNTCFRLVLKRSEGA